MLLWSSYESTKTEPMRRSTICKSISARKKCRVGNKYLSLKKSLKHEDVTLHISGVRLNKRRYS